MILNGDKCINPNDIRHAHRSSENNSYVIEDVVSFLIRTARGAIRFGVTAKCEYNSPFSKAIVNRHVLPIVSHLTFAWIILSFNRFFELTNVCIDNLGLAYLRQHRNI